MTDDKSKRGPADRIRISLKEPHELAYWRRKFNCTADQLREAVETAGHMAVDVASYLLEGDYEDDGGQDEGQVSDA